MLPPLPGNPRNPGNPGNPGMRSEASIFSNPSVDFETNGKATPKKAPKPQKVASRADETPTCSEGICPGVGPNIFFAGRRCLTTLPSLSATCPNLNTIFFSRHAKIFYYSGPRTSPGRPRAERPPAARPPPGRPPAAAPQPPPVRRPPAQPPYIYKLPINRTAAVMLKCIKNRWRRAPLVEESPSNKVYQE